jgi:hypothetical protein
MGRYTPRMGHERRFPGTSVNGRPKRARECLLKVMSADRALARRTSGTGPISAARMPMIRWLLLARLRHGVIGIACGFRGKSGHSSGTSQQPSLDPMLTSVTLTAPPTASEAPPLAQGPDDYLRVAPVFRCAPRPTASDAIAWDGEPRMVEREQKKARNHPSCRRWNCRYFSARFHRKDKDLAGINTIWISDLIPVRFVNDCVSYARAVGVGARTVCGTRHDCWQRR